jgi:hypothetical protein
MSPATATASGRRELELVVLCARLVLDGHARERVTALLEEPLDWEMVLKWAGCHHVTSLLYHHVHPMGPSRVPPEILQELHTRYRGIAARTLNLTMELLSLLEDLGKAGAPGVVWKGPALAHTVYPSPELRAFADLDIIVRPEDRHRARTALNQRGYRGSPAVRLNEDELFSADSQDATMWNPEARISVDVHWGSVPRYRASIADFELLWSESMTVTLHGARLQVLEPGAHLLALCAHGAKHRPFPWPAVKWITDMEAFLRTYPPEWWGPVLKRAQREGCLRMLLLGLVLAEDILEAPLPPDVTAALVRHPTVRELAAGTRRRVLNPAGAVFPLGERLAFDLAVRERWRDRFTYRVTRLFTPTRRDDTTALPVPVRRFAVPLRLLRLGRTYLFQPRALRTLLRGPDPGGADADGGPDPGRGKESR